MRGVREHRYDLDEGPALATVGAALSHVGRLAPVTACSGVVSAAFYDTGRLALAGAGITVRRAQGASDAGWQVDLPGDGDGAGAEYWLPLRAGNGVPHDVQALVARHAGGKSLRRVAQVRIARTSFELVGSEGTALARIADDCVVGLRERDGAATTWRELAVSPLRGAPACGEEIDRVLAGMGVRTCSSPSKLARVLAAPVPDGTRRSDPLAERFGAQLSALLRAEPSVREGEGEVEAVHEMRIAVRRLRSCASVFSAAFAPGSLDDLAGDLAELGRLLGAARDADVLAARLEADLAAVPPVHVLGPVRAVIRAHSAREVAAARRALVGFLDGPAYGALLDHLAVTVSDPPFAEVDRSKAWHRTQLRRADRRLERLVARAGALRGDERIQALHTVRKAAKHARYAAETVTPVLGKDAARRAEVLAQLQDALGEHHDAVAARAFLREEGARAGVRPGENGFTYGLLYEREDVLVAAAEARFDKRWRKRSRSAR